MICSKTWASTAVVSLATMLACGTKDGNADSAATSDGSSSTDSTSDSEASGDSGTTSVTDTTDTTGDPPGCDPSDAEIGPAVDVTILNLTAAPLYLTESAQCMYGAPFGVATGGQALSWIFGICDSCADSLQGNCQCPGPCSADSVIRIDAGGQYMGSWPGADIYLATLTAECADEFCGDQCNALAQAEAGDYVANAIAGPMVTCEVEPCDCIDAPDPDGWCRINGARAGADIASEVAFAYPSQTAVEISFN